MRASNLRGKGLKLIPASGGKTTHFSIVDGSRVMRNILSNFLKNQSGQTALVNMLILVCVGGVVITPLLGFMAMGLKSGQMHEELTEQLYAADSGVEDALFWIPELESGNSTGPWNWQVDHWTRDTYEMNDGYVDSTVEQVDTQTYKITSTASTDDTGNTTIQSYVTTLRMDFSELLQNAISSSSNVTIKPNVNVTGDVTANGTVDNKGAVNGTITENATLDWPGDEDMSAFYWEDVEALEPFPYGAIDVKDTHSIEPLYREGNLYIDNTGPLGAVLTLTGTVYVTGDLIFQEPGESHDYAVDLNGQTIYCEGSISVSDKCSIAGSGCIIAVGDLYFAPKGDVGSEDDFVLLMSIEGTTTLQPSGAFYGSVAGDVCVQVKSGQNAALCWTDPSDKDLNFPEGNVITALSILSWEIL